MCCVHNALIRGLNSIYVQAPHTKPVDYKAFLGYALSWFKMLHHHHDIEERYFFAELQKQVNKEVMQVSVEEHRAFHDGVERYHAYITSLSGQEEKFSGTKLLEIIDELAPPLLLHLNHEIDAILDLRQLKNDKLISSIWDKAVAAGINEFSAANLLDEFPFGFLTHDATYEGGLHKNFPPVPFLLKFFVTYVCTLWNWSWWKFAPCDKSGNPKPLHAVPSSSS
jgi:hypothetical protein